MTVMNGVVSINGATIRSDIAGLFQVYDDETSVDIIRLMAPDIDVKSRHSRMFKVRDSSLVNEVGVDNPVDAVGFNAPAKLGTQGFETFTLVTQRYAFGKVIISDTDQAEASAIQANLEAVWAATYGPQGWDVTARIIGAELADTANYDATLQSTSLNVSVATANLQGALRGAIRAYRSLGINPARGELHAFINDVMADLMLGLNQVTSLPALSAVPSGGTQVRFGTNGYDDLVSFFDKEGIVLHILPTRTIRSNGTVTPVLANDLYLLFCGSGQSRSFLKRGISAAAMGGPGVPIAFPSYDPVGVGIYMNGEWGLAVTSNKLGFIFAGIDS